MSSPKNFLRQRTEYSSIPIEMDNFTKSQTKLAPQKTTTAGFIHKSLNWTAIVVSFGVLLGWLISNFRNMPLVVNLEGVAIGGNLTLTQAKAIDFVTSAILAPLVLAAFNFIWFSNARRFLADGRKGGTNLYTLVEASGTAAGTYDLFKIWALITAKSKPFLSFTALVLFSAISKSALSNIVAYEAFMSPGVSTTTSLRMLADVDVASSTQTYLSRRRLPATYSFNRQQTSAFASNISSLLQTVAWQNASAKLIDGVYVAPNITSSALQLPRTYMVLEDVPALKATINCTTYTPNFLNATDLGDSSSWVIRRDNESPFEAIMPGSASNFITIATGYEGVSFMGFSKLTEDIFIGVFFPDGPPTGVFQTDFGIMNVSLVDGTVNGKAYTSSNRTWTTFGMGCSINKQSGTTKLSRGNVNDNWKMSDKQWDQGMIAQSSHLRNLQLNLGASQTGFGRVAGIASTLTSNARNLSVTDVARGAASADPDSEFGVENSAIHFPDGLDWGVVADNILWTTMETQRMAFEAAAMNSSKAKPDSFTTVSATTEVQRYRITFVPVLLSAGLLSLLLAAIQAFALMVYADKSAGIKMPEPVDSLRLVMDSLEGLKDESMTRDVKGMSNTQLEDWAKRKRVGYYDLADDAGFHGDRLSLRMIGQ